MSDRNYQEALRLGKKEYKSKVSKGEFPYLPVLDEILSFSEIQTEQNMGLMDIPLEFVVGTSTVGRTYAFASNFMPILDDGSEFEYKWISLCEAQENEGIRDPIKCYEYMNRYYVVEGNKRVSVLKYFGAGSISANVTRKVPKYSDEPNVKRYYELMKFQEITGIYTIEFTKPGMANLIIDNFGKKEKWTKEDRDDFNKTFFYFSKVYNFRGGKNLSITEADAFAAFIDVYGYEDVSKMTEKELDEYVLKVWKEFTTMSGKHMVDLVMDPSENVEKKSLISRLLSSSQKTLKVAFLYPRDPETSNWIYAHELGRNYLEETFPDQIETQRVLDVNEENVFEISKELVEQNVDIMFQVGPQMLPPTLKFAAEHPEIKILNCSLNDPYQHIRTYYSRMYEAKFITGMIAGAMADNDKIAYIADYPIYGMIANINAFALGVACTNPRAKIYLLWSTSKDYDRDKFLYENDIHYVSDQDMITPESATRQYGFYKYENGETTNLVMPVWNWGVFYEKLIQGILAGTYESEAVDEKGAINYWWGMSAGVIDFICSEHVPKAVKTLSDHIKDDVIDGSLVPFFGEIYDQDGNLKNEALNKLNPREIMKMDYLVENVVGSIPSMEELVDKAKAVVELKGVEEKK